MELLHIEKLGGGVLGVIAEKQRERKIETYSVGERGRDRTNKCTHGHARIHTLLLGLIFCFVHFVFNRKDPLMFFILVFSLRISH